MNFSMFKRYTCLVITVSILLIAAFDTQASEGRNRFSMICDEAIEFASLEFNVPREVLKAIARTESGITVSGSFIAWPWTVNIEGRGVRFSTQSEALGYFKDNFARGARNIDLGCFQINHRWHGENFVSANDMLNPAKNARYAARFLKDLHNEFGDWTAAAGAFHSRTPEFSKKYLARYEPILRELNGSPGMEKGWIEAIPKTNEFPLLTGKSQSRANGSLFPSTTRSRGSLLFASPERG